MRIRRRHLAERKAGMNQPYILLSSGKAIPQVGLGVFKSAEETADAVCAALAAGYRHIDTATAYGNEKLVGEGIRRSGVSRSEIFLTTKLWNDDMRAGTQAQAIERSLEALGTDYIDLYLIHWPVKDYFVPSWKILEDYHRQGVLRSIGVSNFQDYHLDELLRSAEILPAVDQVECHPYLTQERISAYCAQRGIAIEAWSPLGKGNVLADPAIAAIAKSHGKSPAQIIIRWHIQNGRIVIPKSVHEDRIRENAAVFDFTLTQDEMDQIAGLNRNQRFGSDPDNFNF